MVARLGWGIAGCGWVARDYVGPAIRASSKACVHVVTRLSRHPAGMPVSCVAYGVYADCVVVDKAPSPSTEWLSANKAGELLGVTGRTVARWINDGKLRGRMTEGGRYRVNRDDVERLAAAQESRAVQPQSRSSQRRKEDRA